MAAVQIDQNTGQKRITLPATPDECQEIILPVWAKRVSIFAESHAAKFAMSGVDGGALGSDHISIAQGGYFSRMVFADRDNFDGLSIFVASAHASCVVVIIAEQS